MLRYCHLRKKIKLLWLRCEDSGFFCVCIGWYKLFQYSKILFPLVYARFHCLEKFLWFLCKYLIFFFFFFKMKTWLLCKGKKSDQGQQDSHPNSSDNLGLLYSFVEHSEGYHPWRHMKDTGKEIQWGRSREGIYVAVSLGIFLSGAYFWWWWWVLGLIV